MPVCLSELAALVDHLDVLRGAGCRAAVLRSAAVPAPSPIIRPLRRRPYRR